MTIAAKMPRMMTTIKISTSVKPLLRVRRTVMVRLQQKRLFVSLPLCGPFYVVPAWQGRRRMTNHAAGIYVLRKLEVVVGVGGVALVVHLGELRAGAPDLPVGRVDQEPFGGRGRGRAAGDVSSDHLHGARAVQRVGRVG